MPEFCALCFRLASEASPFAPVEWAPLSPLFPVFLLVVIGFIFARWKNIVLAPLTEIIVYLGTPSLVFASLAGKPLFASEFAALCSGLALIFLGVGLIPEICFIAFGFCSRGFALPAGAP